MKKVNLLIQGIKADILAALTPAAKRELLEDAKAFIKHDIPGIWGTLALAVLTELEATIKDPVTTPVAAAASGAAA